MTKTSINHKACPKIVNTCSGTTLSLLDWKAKGQQRVTNYQGYFENRDI